MLEIYLPTRLQLGGAFPAPRFDRSCRQGPGRLPSLLPPIKSGVLGLGQSRRPWRD